MAWDAFQLKPYRYGATPNPNFVERNKEKERTIKSGRNSVYGAPEHRCQVELATVDHVRGKSSDALQRHCQMVKAFSRTNTCIYKERFKATRYYRCTDCLCFTVKCSHV